MVESDKSIFVEYSEKPFLKSSCYLHLEWDRPISMVVGIITSTLD